MAIMSISRMFFFPMTITWRLYWSIKLVIVRLNNINHNGEHDKRKLTHQLLDKPKLKFSFLAKSQVKKIQLANFS